MLTSGKGFGRSPPSFAGDDVGAAESAKENGRTVVAFALGADVEVEGGGVAVMGGAVSATMVDRADSVEFATALPLLEGAAELMTGYAKSNAGRPLLNGSPVDLILCAMA